MVTSRLRRLCALRTHLFISYLHCKIRVESLLYVVVLNCAIIITNVYIFK